MTDERATETVEVRDANAAHKLIGRSIDGRRISSIRVYPDAFDVRVGLQFVAAREWGKSVEVDALPPATMWVHLDDLPGHTLPGETRPVHGFGPGKEDGWIWWSKTDSYANSHPLTIVDHMVEVLAPVPVVEAPDEVTVREALAGLVQVMAEGMEVAETDDGHRAWIARRETALTKARAALAADRGEA
jgi:hypothetical protein